MIAGGGALRAAAGTLVCGLVMGAPAPADAGWWRDLDGEPYAEPLPSLPESINGVLRSSMRPGENAGPIDRIRDVFAAIRACWRPPDRPTGQEVTLRLSFKRSGDVLGRPRITYLKAARGAQDREAFTRSVAAAFDACTPLRFSQKFGAAIAGRPFTFRFSDDRPI